MHCYNCFSYACNSIFFFALFPPGLSFSANQFMPGSPESSLSTYYNSNQSASGNRKSTVPKLATFENTQEERKTSNQSVSLQNPEPDQKFSTKGNSGADSYSNQSGSRSCILL
ncbi:hypothetical protein CHS0354_028969 [Potamilus streckersoni]|uniref:Uncharacterized protein n=1 Tax=Potamilus streckersoni TaxID=2493646 RepID=A0AAE0VTC2_9BIVA|nr:hypothetical protein CHS0354_028969 [Potamilus streckersoni]